MLAFEEQEKELIDIPYFSGILGKAEKGKQTQSKQILLSLSTLKEHIHHSERMIQERRWGRFVFIFREFEFIFLDYLRKAVPLRGTSDVYLAWTRFFQYDSDPYLVEYNLERIQETYRLWSKITKIETKVNNLTL